MLLQHKSLFEDLEDSELVEGLAEVRETIDDKLRKKPEVALIRHGDNFSLVRPNSHMYISHKLGTKRPDKQFTVTIPDNYFQEEVPWLPLSGLIQYNYDESEEPFLKKGNKSWYDYAGIVEKGGLLIKSSHRIDFAWDTDLRIYLPRSADTQDIALPLVSKRSYSPNEAPRIQNVDILTDMDTIINSFSDNRIVRPQYLQSNIVPFLNGETTGLNLPTPNQKTIETGIEKFKKKTKKMPHGQLIYIACENGVFCMTLSRDDDRYYSEKNEPSMIGDIPVSVDYPLYFSNRVLGPFSYKKGKTEFSAPGFGKQPFVFTEIGRNFNPRNPPFATKTLEITDDVNRAISHFEKETLWGEYSGVLHQYVAGILNKKYL